MFVEINKAVIVRHPSRNSMAKTHWEAKERRRVLRSDQRAEDRSSGCGSTGIVGHALAECTDRTSPYTHEHIFLVARHTIQPMHLHWLQMCLRFSVSLFNHPIRATCHSWVFLSSLHFLLS